MATLREARRALEFKRCQMDLVYFLTNYWKVFTVGVGYGKFDLFDYQVETARDFQAMQEYADRKLANPEWEPAERVRLREVDLKARQLGMTTVRAGSVFWSAFFHGNHPWLLLAQGQDDANKTMSMALKNPMNMLPEWMLRMGPELTRETGEELEWSNGSSIASLPSTSSAGRGRAAFGVILDENAFMAEPGDVYAAVEPMCYGPLFIFSTANGMGNFFHETWLDSQLSDSAWSFRFYPWNARPGRDDGWYVETKRKYRGREHLFYQEYPSTPEEAFAKSGKTAFDMDLVREQDIRPPDHVYDLQVVRSELLKDWSQDWERVFQNAEVQLVDRVDFELRVWEKPHVLRDEMGRVAQDPNYVVAVDVAEGLDHGDFSAISVRNVNTSETVATVLAHIPVYDLGSYAEIIAYWYFTALLGVERNNFGLVPLQYLQQAGYPRLYRMDTIAQLKQGDRTPRFGYHTNRATKPKMVNDFTRGMADGTLRFHDERLVHEMSTFLSDGKGGFAAQSPNHDDLVMAEMIGYQLEQDVGQYPMAWFDPEPGLPTFGDVFAMAEPVDASWGAGLAGGIGQKERPGESRRSFEMIQT